MIHSRNLLAGLILLLLVTGGCSICLDSSVVPAKVSNGQIVLVRMGTNNYGALIPKSQKAYPDELEFQWYYRTDGKGTFRSAESADYSSGVGTGAPDGSVPYLKANFGPFSVGWSGREDGLGSVYYPRFPGETVSPDDLAICVTNEADIENIDAADPRWVYKSSP